MIEIEKFSLKEQLTPRKISKFIVGGSIRFVVSSSITTLVPTETRVEKAKVFVGSNMIASVIAHKACERVDEFFDGLKKDVEEVKAESNETDVVVIHTMTS